MNAMAINQQLQDMEAAAAIAPRCIVAGVAGGGSGGKSSPDRSNSAGSGLFDALVMAATGGSVMTDEAAAGGVLNGAGRSLMQDPFAIMSRQPLPVPGGAPNVVYPLMRPAVVGSFEGPPVAAAIPQRMHAPPQKNRSRLWSALSSGELDSLQVGKELEVLEGV